MWIWFLLILAKSKNHNPHRVLQLVHIPTIFFPHCNLIIIIFRGNRRSRGWTWNDIRWSPDVFAKMGKENHDRPQNRCSWIENSLYWRETYIIWKETGILSVDIGALHKLIRKVSDMWFLDCFYSLDLKYVNLVAKRRHHCLVG